MKTISDLHRSIQKAIHSPSYSGRYTENIAEVNMIADELLDQTRRFWAYWTLRAFMGMPENADAGLCRDLEKVLTRAGFKPGSATAKDLLAAPPTRDEPQ